MFLVMLYQYVGISEMSTHSLPRPIAGIVAPVLSSKCKGTSIETLLTKPFAIKNIWLIWKQSECWDEVQTNLLCFNNGNAWMSC